MDPDGIRKAWMTKVRMRSANPTANRMAFTYSTVTDSFVRPLGLRLLVRLDGFLGAFRAAALAICQFAHVSILKSARKAS